MEKPASILREIHVKTYNEVFESNHATVGELASRGQDWRLFVLAYISSALTNYLDFVGRKNTMDDMQIAETAELMLDEFPTLKMDDLVLFFRMCKISHFGKLYDLNGGVIFDWLNTYLDERETARLSREARIKAEYAALEERRMLAERAAMTEEDKEAERRNIEEIQERMMRKLQNRNITHQSDDEHFSPF
ncbi:MAG: hypothetical protein IKN59_01735 [Paludibacteraceae bacterium]|nr:hypothetical protein [Paludibacteraceae bacterium]